MIYQRLQKLPLSNKETCFLWGPRQSGKSTLLKKLFGSSLYYDLLRSDEFERINKNPSILREEILQSIQLYKKHPIILDEVQKIPALLDEIQWLIVNKGLKFILCGSSARKLKRGGGNLLGGRAVKYELFPLVYKEIKNFDLLKALNNGLVPRHYLSDHPADLIRAYVGDYLKEEIAQEALTRKIPSFGRFLEAAAFSSGEIVNYNNIASECGVSAPTVKEYFQILVDTLIARFIPAYQKKPKRRVIQSPKFYYFDIGITNYLLKRGRINNGSELFGKAFEHFIFQELTAHSHYSGIHYPVSYWRTASQLEVDFILGNNEVAIEVKSSEQINAKHIKNIKSLSEEYLFKKLIVVSLDKRPRLIGNIEILPWKMFLDKLWSGDIIK